MKKNILYLFFAITAVFISISESKAYEFINCGPWQFAAGGTKQCRTCTKYEVDDLTDKMSITQYQQCVGGE